jgi:hypothetical protein
MRRTLGVVLTALLLASCSGKQEDGAAANATAAADTLTRRQKDSILANSKLPMAGAVGRALGAADKANAHLGAEDSAGAFRRRP